MQTGNYTSRRKKKKGTDAFIRKMLSTLDGGKAYGCILSSRGISIYSAEAHLFLPAIFFAVK